MNTPRAVAVATNAFGMGINKPDIRLVVHYQIPGTLEAYYQEAGRAGRDGQPSRCVLLFNYPDRYIQEFFIDKIGEDNPDSDPTIDRRAEAARHDQKLELMLRYAQTHRCRRQMILDYFGEETRVQGLPVRRLPAAAKTPTARPPAAGAGHPRRSGPAGPAAALGRRPAAREVRRRRRRRGPDRLRERAAAALGLGPALGLRPAPRPLGQAGHRHAAPADGGGPGPPARPRRREVPPGDRADRQRRAGHEGRESSRRPA